MENYFLPALIFFVLIGTLALRYLNFFSSRLKKSLWIILCLIILILVYPRNGLDSGQLGIFSFAILSSSIILFFIKFFDKKSVFLDKRTFRILLLILCILSVLVYFNFFSFHGQGIFVHLHDMAHYYLGSKYFKEVGYTNLYNAMIVAEAETYNNFKTIQIRNLDDYSLLDIREVLVNPRIIKDKFSWKRWYDFRKDVAYFRESMGPKYAEIFTDHGYNPSPFWTLIGGTLSNLVPAGSAAGIKLLSLIDTLLFAGIFVMIAFSFGFEALILSIIFLCTGFGANFSYIGGSLLRYLELFCMVGSLCALKKNKYILSGSLLSIPFLLRIFPIMFFFTIVCGYFARKDDNALRNGYKLFIYSFIACAFFLFLVSILFPNGLPYWQDFTNHITLFNKMPSPNTVGLIKILIFRGQSVLLNWEGFQKLIKLQNALHFKTSLLLFPFLIFLIYLMSRRLSKLELFSCGIILLFFTSKLAGYYYLFLVLYLLIYSEDLIKIIFVFLPQAITYLIALFRYEEATVYFFYSLAMLYMLLALYYRPLKETISDIYLRYKPKT